VKVHKKWDYQQPCRKIGVEILLPRPKKNKNDGGWRITGTKIAYIHYSSITENGLRGFGEDVFNGMNCAEGQYLIFTWRWKKFAIKKIDKNGKVIRYKHKIVPYKIARAEFRKVGESLSINWIEKSRLEHEKWYRDHLPDR